MATCKDEDQGENKAAFDEFLTEVGRQHFVFERSIYCMRVFFFLILYSGQKD